MRKHTIISIACYFILIPLVILGGVFFLDDRKYYFISLIVIILMMIPMFARFEGRRVSSRELVLMATLTALVVASRSIAFMFPQLKPMMAIIILSGIALGGESGFMIGALSAFVSNFFFGQGPWTPWQMFAFGLIGFLSGAIFSKLPRNKIPISIFGFLATIVVFGGIMNPSSVLMSQAEITVGAVLISYINGFVYDMGQAVATFIYLFIFTKPFLQKLERIQTKYGLLVD